MPEIIISIIILLTAIPLAFLLNYLTKDEKPIYNKYFPAFLWVIAILAAIFWSINLQTALTLTFMFILVFVWRLL